MPTEPSCYLARLALDKKIDPLVLIAQLAIEFLLESIGSFGFIVAARYGSCLNLSLGCADLDEVLDIIVIDIIWCRVTS